MSKFKFSQNKSTCFRIDMDEQNKRLSSLKKEMNKGKANC